MNVRPPDLAPARLTDVHTGSMRTSDGVRLDADIWMPKGDGPFPVLMMRQAYGRRLNSSLCYAHAAWYARQGFIVVIQDVRGRGTSEGVFETLSNEARDGAEAIAWAAGLPKSNGRVGMFGFSYQGTNQLLAAAEAPEALKAVAPAMFGWNVRQDWCREGDAFRLASNIGWGLQMAAETARLQADHEAWNGLYAAARAAPVESPTNSRPPILERWRHLGHYHDWMERSAEDPYWPAISPHVALDRLSDRQLPCLLIGGWFDTHLPGTLAAFDDMVAAGMGHVHLAVGPWTHFPWDRRVGDLDFGPHAVTAIDHLQVDWFKYWLTDAPEEGAGLPRLSLFEMGANRWRALDRWCEDELLFFLGGSGRASIDQQDGVLAERASPDGGAEYLVHDPWRPAPSVGGAFGSPPGPVNRAKIDARNDVLTFTTRPLEQPLFIAGKVAARLWLESDSASFDLACVLSRVTADGQVLQLAEGFQHVPSHFGQEPVAVSLRATCANLAPGEQLRLSVSAAAFPAYPVNPGDGREPTEASRAEAGIITLALMTGGKRASRLVLGGGRDEITP
jgi:putative CocE/NonD family hydrolase